MGKATEEARPAAADGAAGEAVAPREVQRAGAGGPPRPEPDRVAVEEPLEIRLAGHRLAVVMRTPGDDLDLVTGFLLTEGVVERAADIAAMAPAHEPDTGAAIPSTVDVRLAPGLTVDLGALQRNLFASSSCGVCGKASIEAVLRRAPALSAPGGACSDAGDGGPIGPRPLARSVIVSLPAAMRAAQAAFAQTGGIHAAAVFDRAGALLAAREDVGRHNAVDKALGALLRAGDRRGAVLLVSGRASFEVVQKALFAGIPAVCAVSAPTSLAVDAAREAGQTLIGFLRDGAFNAYAGADRIAWDA